MKDLRDFIKLLRDKGQLRVIDTPVDPVLEITEIADRVVKAGGPALLFTQPQGLARSRCSSTSSAATSACAWRCAPGSYDELAARVEKLRVPGGARRRPGRS